MNCWPLVRQLLNRTLKTLDRKNPFEVVAVTEKTVLVQPRASGKERSIRREEITGAFAELERRGEITRTEIHDHHSARNPAYVAAILAALPGVQASVSPITLRYRPPSK